MKTNKTLALLSILLIVTTGCNPNKKEKNLYNNSATLNGKIENSDANELLKWHMVTLLKDTKNNTVLVLYANDIAFKSVIKRNNHYRVGSSLALVSWHEKPDIHWFGATILGSVDTIKKVDISANSNGQPVQLYSTYINDKQGLIKINKTDSQLVRENTNFILSMKRPYLPD